MIADDWRCREPGIAARDGIYCAHHINDIIVVRLLFFITLVLGLED